MQLGTHHIALNVKSLAASKDFYSKLGFEVDPRFSNEQRHWLIMRNGNLIIGLYENIIPRNTITFTPDNVRDLQKHLKEKGLKFIIEADEKTTGAAHFLLVDPDGNPLFFEQHR